jgi:hypothetical protein
MHQSDAMVDSWSRQLRIGKSDAKMLMMMMMMMMIKNTILL